MSSRELTLEGPIIVVQREEVGCAVAGEREVLYAMPGVIRTVSPKSKCEQLTCIQTSPSGADVVKGAPRR
jgi:hypothetical protein